MLVDYHLHTYYSRHATGDIAEYLQRAEQLGISEVCFTEHSSREYLPDNVRSQVPYSWMEPEELYEYLGWLQWVDEATSLTVRKGLEVDYFAGYDQSLKAQLAKSSGSLDFILASIHFLPEYDFTYITMLDVDPVPFFLTYFARAKQAVESGLFDSIAHLHLGWQAASWPLDSQERRRIEGALAEVVQTAAATEVALEVNTRALNFEGRGSLEQYEFFVSLIADYAAHITLGSDAHSPMDVGRNYHLALNTLQKFGIREVATFSKRQRTMVTLE